MFRKIHSNANSFEKKKKSENGKIIEAEYGAKRLLMVEKSRRRTTTEKNHTNTESQRYTPSAFLSPRRRKRRRGRKSPTKLAIFDAWTNGRCVRTLAREWQSVTGAVDLRKTRTPFLEYCDYCGMVHASSSSSLAVVRCAILFTHSNFLFHFAKKSLKAEIKEEKKKRNARSPANTE